MTARVPGRAGCRRPVLLFRKRGQANFLQAFLPACLPALCRTLRKL